MISSLKKASWSEPTARQSTVAFTRFWWGLLPETWNKHVNSISVCHQAEISPEEKLLTFQCDMKQLNVCLLPWRSCEVVGCRSAQVRMKEQELGRCLYRSHPGWNTAPPGCPHSSPTERHTSPGCPRRCWCGGTTWSSLNWKTTQKQHQHQRAALTCAALRLHSFSLTLQVLCGSETILMGHCSEIHNYNWDGRPMSASAPCAEEVSHHGRGFLHSLQDCVASVSEDWISSVVEFGFLREAWLRSADQSGLRRSKTRAAKHINKTITGLNNSVDLFAMQTDCLSSLPLWMDLAGSGGGTEVPEGALLAGGFPYMKSMFS